MWAERGDWDKQPACTRRAVRDVYTGEFKHVITHGLLGRALLRFTLVEEGAAPRQT